MHITVREQVPHNTMDPMTIWEHLRRGSLEQSRIPVRDSQAGLVQPERVPVLRREEPEKKGVMIDAEMREDNFEDDNQPQKTVPAVEVTAKSSAPAENIQEETVQEPVSAPTEDESNREVIAEPQFRVLGELFGAYIVAECDNEAIIIDKHAAHERIRYEQLLREQELGSAPAVQTLLTPIVLTLEPAEAAAVAENEALLRSYGVVAENFGGHDLVIRELPEDVKPEHAAQLVSELARALRHTSHAHIREMILHRMACHSAVRAGEYTTMAEMEALTKIVLTTPELKHCPHGRPVAMIMSKQDFIRNFER